VPTHPVLFSSRTAVDSHKCTVLFHGEWCALCYVGRRARESHRGHIGGQSHRNRGVEMTHSFLDRVPSGNGSAGPSGDASPGEWSSVYPALSEFLVASRWSNGDVRIPGTLTLFTDGPTWKLCLSDRSQGRVAFVSGASPPLALQAAEAGLVGSTLDWRFQKGNSTARRQKGS